MKEARELAAAIVRHIRETLQRAHSHEEHRDMLEALGDVEKALEQDDETEALRDLVALSEAIDLSIPDAELERKTEPGETDDDAGDDANDDETNK